MFEDEVEDEEIIRATAEEDQLAEIARVAVPEVMGQPLVPSQADQLVDGVPALLARPQEDLIVSAPLLPESEDKNVVSFDPITLEGSYSKPVSIDASNKKNTSMVEPPSVDGIKDIEEMSNASAKQSLAHKEKAAMLNLEANNSEVKALQEKANLEQAILDNASAKAEESHNMLKEAIEKNKVSAAPLMKRVPSSETSKTNLMIAGFLSGFGSGMLGKSDNFGAWLSKRTEVVAKKALAQHKLNSANGVRSVKDAKTLNDSDYRNIKMVQIQEMNKAKTLYEAKAKSANSLKIAAKFNDAAEEIGRTAKKEKIELAKLNMNQIRADKKLLFMQGADIGVVKKGDRVRDKATMKRTVNWGDRQVVTTSEKMKNKMDEYVPAVSEMLGIVFEMKAIQEEIGNYEVTQDFNWIRGPLAAKYAALQKILVGKIGLDKSKGGVGMYPAGVLQEWDLKAIGKIATEGIELRGRVVLNSLLSQLTSNYELQWKSGGVNVKDLPPSMRIRGLGRDGMKRARRLVKGIK